MPLAEAKCPNCGAKLSVDSEKDAAVCEFCGTPYIVEKAIEGAISNSTINNSVINVYNNNKNQKQEKELSEEELYTRYLEEYKAIKKDIRKSKLRAFIAALILALIFFIMLYIGWNSKEEGALKNMLTGFGLVGTPAFILLSIKMLLQTTASDARRIKKLNDAYENAHLKKKFK